MPSAFLDWSIAAIEPAIFAGNCASALLAICRALEATVVCVFLFSFPFQAVSDFECVEGGFQ